MPVIEFQNVSKVYKVGQVTVRALDGVDLKIEQGEFVAILGPSGSGKSTLMHLLGFLDTPTSGKVFVEGQELSSCGAIERAKIRAEKIGFIFQAFNLLPRLNVLRNTLLPVSYSRNPNPRARERVWEVLDQVGMRDRAHHRPNQLSGGQKQRVAIARALINEPRIILADEPTGNLDSQTARTILELFAELHRQGRTIIVVTHDAGVASYSKRQIHVLDGKIADPTTPAEVAAATPR
ncbi:MAG: lipoprotein-releasing system ATP-binding protein [Chthoniobacter sp.]|jgi:ABC-type lipoprotein export system ATPase subunit|nr:lipoprotein-releasing system ATP-binding protein [Chthoniobacter sp.]